jgi:hypothetical protein
LTTEEPTPCRLVDRVVDDLVDEVVQAARPRRADVHAGTLADGFEALEDRDVRGTVRRIVFGVFLRQRGPSG